MLALKQPWPSTLRTVYNDQERYEQTYFGPFQGYYFTGDGCRRDEDGYFWITGRVDDVINVSDFERVSSDSVGGGIRSYPYLSDTAMATG